MTNYPLIQRLRSMSETGWNPIGNEAANEIEQLQAKVAEQQAEIVGLYEMNLVQAKTIATITRQRDLAVEALTTSLDALRLPCDRWNKVQYEIVKQATENADQAISAIKESEA